MTREERALLQERVKTLVLGHALEAVLAKFVDADQAAGRDAEADLSRMEEMLLSAARGLADRATSQKLSVLVAVEDVSAIVRTAFDAARETIDLIRPADEATGAAIAA